MDGKKNTPVQIAKDFLVAIGLILCSIAALYLVINIWY